MTGPPILIGLLRSFKETDFCRKLMVVLTFKSICFQIKLLLSVATFVSFIGQLVAEREAKTGHIVLPIDKFFEYCGLPFDWFFGLILRVFAKIVFAYIPSSRFLFLSFHFIDRPAIILLAFNWKAQFRIAFLLVNR